MRIKIALKLLIYFALISSFWTCGSISEYNQYSLSDRDYSSSENPEEEEEEKPLFKWKLHSVKLNGREYINIPDKNYITLTIWVNNHCSGYLGCNGFRGNVEIKDNLIQFNNLWSTSRGCPGNPSIEKIVFDALRNANNYEVKGNMLYLKHDKEVLVIYTPSLVSH